MSQSRLPSTDRQAQAPDSEQRPTGGRKLEPRPHEAESQLLRLKLAEAEGTRDLLRQFFAATPAACFTLDASGTIIEANAPALALLGFAGAPFQRRTLFARLSAEGAGRFRHYLQELFASSASASRLDTPSLDTPRTCSLELTLYAPGRPPTDVRLESIGAPISSTGQCGMTVVDLTPAATPQEQEEHFRLIADHLEDVYYQTDASGLIGCVSAAYEDIWNRPASAARGTRWFGSVHPDDAFQVHEAQRLLFKGDPFDEEYRIIRPSGEVRWVRDRAYLIDQPYLQVVGVAHDITDERQIDQELSHAQKLEALGTLSTNVAHDFGNLLQGLMGCLNVALAPTTAPDVARDYTRQALASVRSGASLVAQLTTFGRKDRVQRGPLSLDVTIRACAPLLQRLLGHHIHLRIETLAPDATILADAIQIEQILMNLAANARDAMPEGGELFIRTEELTSEDLQRLVLLEVRDVGCGMPREAQLRAFEPFFSTKGSGKGTGLGLSTVRAVTRALGGQVHLESELQRGTTFTFHFPISRAPLIVASSAPRESQFRGRALLVEDDDWVRVSVRQYLQDLGLDVLEASSVEEAVSSASGSLSLLVSDVILPNVTGPRIRSVLQAQYPNLKTLYISAHPAYHLIERGLLDKGDALLQKPFERSALAARLTELLSVQTGAAPGELARLEHAAGLH